jgi:hypothetical protein
MSGCQTCLYVLDCLFDPEDESWEVDLGSFEQALRSPCRDHTAIVKHLKEVSGHRYFQHRNARFALSIGSGERLHIAPLIRSDDGMELFEHTLGLVRKKEIPSHPGRALILDPQWIENDTAKSWIKECTLTYGEECDNPLKIKQTPPELLIDVKRRCIVQGTRNLSYVALSYRMGDMAPFRMDEQMLQNFTVDFALDDRDVIRKLPLTVHHAISLAALWAKIIYGQTCCAWFMAGMPLLTIS